MVGGCCMIADPTNIEPVPGFGEPFSALSHLIPAAIFLALAPRLIMAGRGNAWRMAGLSVFAFAIVFQLAMSGVSHQLEQNTTAAQVLLVLDHAAIFFLIAATFTPIHGILFTGFMRTGVLIFLWAAAITGIVLKSIFFEQTPIWVGASLYAGLGWMGLISGIALLRRDGFASMALLLYGGLAYTAGLIFEIITAKLEFQPVPGFIGGHEIFHICVLAGMALHWKFISSFAAGRDTRLLPHSPASSAG